MKELKIAELAEVWGCSIPTVWSRIKKKQLAMVLKKDNTGKEVNFVCIPDEVIKEYLNNGYNEVYNGDNNAYNEEMLSVENVNKGLNENQKTSNNIDSIELIFDKLQEVNNDFNDRLERVNNELITYKSKQLLLEDKTNREGLYLQEIKDIKTNNKRLLYGLITVIIVLFIMLSVVTSLLISKTMNTDNKTQNTQIEQKKEA